MKCIMSSTAASCMKHGLLEEFSGVQATPLNKVSKMSKERMVSQCKYGGCECWGLFCGQVQALVPQGVSRGNGMEKLWFHFLKGCLTSAWPDHNPEPPVQLFKELIQFICVLGTVSVLKGFDFTDSSTQSLVFSRGSKQQVKWSSKSQIK